MSLNSEYSFTKDDLVSNCEEECENSSPHLSDKFDDMQLHLQFLQDRFAGIKSIVENNSNSHFNESFTLQNLKIEDNLSNNEIYIKEVINQK
jgi:hypothetical protein